MEELWAKFHQLWSRDVGTPGYDKNKWVELERLILQQCNQTTSSAKTASTETDHVGNANFL